MVEKNASNAIAVKAKRKRPKYNSYAVVDEVCLYKLVDAGLLCHLHGVNKCKDNPQKRVFFFDKHIDVKEVIDTYKAEKSAVS